MTVVAKLKNSLQKKVRSFSALVKSGNGKVTASMCLMGLGQMMYKQWGKGTGIITSSSLKLNTIVVLLPLEI